MAGAAVTDRNADHLLMSELLLECSCVYTRTRIQSEGAAITVLIKHTSTGVVRAPIESRARAAPDRALPAIAADDGVLRAVSMAAPRGLGWRGGAAVAQRRA